MLKKCTILWILFLLVLPLAGIQADSSESEVFCGDLPAADCQLLTESEAVMNQVQSFAMAMSMSVEITGEEPALMTIEGEGRLAIDPELADMTSDVQDMAPMEEMQATLALVEEVLAGIDGTLSIELAQTGGGEEDTQMTLSLLMKDGVIVLDAASLESVFGDSTGSMEWFGLDTAGITELLMSDELMQEGMDDMTDEYQDYPEMAPAIERLPDSEVNGIAVAVFESALGYSALSSLTGLIAIADPSAAGDGSLDTAIDGMLSMRQYIGLEDHYLHRAELSMTIGMAVDETDAGSMDMSMSLNLSDFNQPVAVEIPEDAMILPLMMMMQMGQQ